MRGQGKDKLGDWDWHSHTTIQPQICRYHHPYAESEEELKGLLMKVKEKSEKVGLKLNIQKTKIMASGPSTSWQIDRSEWVKLFSCVLLFATPWSVAHQAPQSMEFSRQEYWSGLPFSSPGDLPNPGIESGSPTLQADALSSEPPRKHQRDGETVETVSDFIFGGLQNHCRWWLQPWN